MIENMLKPRIMHLVISAQSLYLYSIFSLDYGVAFQFFGGLVCQSENLLTVIYNCR